MDVSLRDVMLSQLNYRASAYLNDGVEPQRHPNGAHSYYVPAQLFTDRRRVPGAVHHPRCILESFADGGGRITGFPTMAERAARREEVLAVVSARWPPTRAMGWEARLRPLGIPAAAVRTLPEALAATPEVVVSAGDFRLVRSPIRVAGYEPEYRPPPRLGEHTGDGVTPRSRP